MQDKFADVVMTTALKLANTMGSEFFFFFLIKNREFGTPTEKPGRVHCRPFLSENAEIPCSLILITRGFSSSVAD